MHLITCPCGKAFPVSLAQAGQSVQCPQCSETIALPNLGQLKQLPVAEDIPQANRNEPWSVGRGVLFSALFAGLLAMVIASAWTSYKWMSVPRPPTIDEVIAQGQKEIGQHNAPQLLEFWVNWGQPGMGVRYTPGYAQVQRYREKWQMWSYAAYGGTLALIVAIAVVTRQNAAAKARQGA